MMKNLIRQINFEVAGETGGQSSAETPKIDKQEKSKDDVKEGKTFTQEQVNKMLAEEKRQGRNSAYNSLGIDPSDEARVAQTKNLINALFSDKSEEEELPTDQLPPAVRKKISEAEKLAKENEAKAAKAEAKYLALKNGVDPNFVDDVIALATTKLDDDTSLESVVKGMKETHAFYFGAKQHPKGTGKNVGVSQQASKEKENYGATLAKKRNRYRAGINKK